MGRKFPGLSVRKSIWGKGYSMKRTIVKAVSLVLAFSFVAAIASCAKKDKAKKSKIIAEDTPWFDYTTIDVDSGADPEKDVEYLNQNLAGADDKYYVIYSSGRYQTPPENEIDYSNFDYNSYNFNIVAVVDRNTKKAVNYLDLNKGLDTDLLTYEHVDTAAYIDGKVTVKTNRKIRDYDPLTGKVLNERPSNAKDSVPSSHFYKAGDYLIETEQIWDDYSRTSATVRVTAPDGNVNSFDFNEAGEDLYVQAVLALSDTKVLIPVYTTKGYRYYELDLAANKLSQGKEKDYQWLNANDLGEVTTGIDGQVYNCSSEGVSRIDAVKKSVETVLDYSWCGMNMGVMYFQNLKLAECSSDKMVFIGRTKSATKYGSVPKDFQIIEFTRASKNPNAGKTILELYSTEIDDVIGAAIQKFNDQSNKYYIELADTYNISDFIDVSLYTNIDNNDEWNEMLLKSAAGESNQLAMDILNGEGPDILLNTDSYSRLNKSSYLVDLTPYVKDLGPDKYFTNIIEGSKTGDAIYQLPVSFSIHGLCTDIKYAGSSGVGFTFDEYKSFVRNDLNGFDPMMTGQAVYFSQLFSTMNEKFIADGKADFSGPEFKELADYVKDNVPEKAMSWDEINDSNYNSERAEIFPVRGVGSFYQMLSGPVKSATVLGTPSIDGRGPMFFCNFSVAISAYSADPDACGEFVKILLSDEIQLNIAMNDYFVLNRSAFRKAGTAANEYYNNGGNETASGSGIFHETKFTEADIDNIERIIFTCSKIEREDSDISIILIEEMPAYFLGQKSLDAVIKIAQNRVQKVLDERGK